MIDDAAALGRALPFATVPNLRDLGGYPTRDGGTVRTGLLYRSTELGRLEGDDVAAFAKLGIRTVFDFRTEAERVAEPDRLPLGVESVVIDVMADAEGAAPAHLLEVLSDPAAATELLGEGQAQKLFTHGYREIVGLPSALTGYHRFFTDLGRPRHRPALFHCTTGKDRTGWAAAAMLLLLGVDEEQVMADYLLSTGYLLEAYAPVLEQFRAAGGDPELLKPVIGVDPAYLEAALDEMRTRFGTIEGYFATGLKIGRSEQAALRETFVG